jgi:hypothetical protein
MKLNIVFLVNMELTTIIAREVIKYVDWPTLLNLRLVVRFDFEAYLTGDGKRFIEHDISYEGMWAIEGSVLPNGRHYGIAEFSIITPGQISLCCELQTNRPYKIKEGMPHLHKLICHLYGIDKNVAKLGKESIEAEVTKHHKDFGNVFVSWCRRACMRSGGEVEQKTMLYSLWHEGICISVVYNSDMNF